MNHPHEFWRNLVAWGQRRYVSSTALDDIGEYARDLGWNWDDAEQRTRFRVEVRGAVANPWVESAVLAERTLLARRLGVTARLRHPPDHATVAE